MKQLKILMALGIFALSACSPQNLWDSIPPLTIVPQSLQSEEQKTDKLINYQKCPQIEIVEELGHLYDFGTATNFTDENLASYVEIEDKGANCAFTKKSVTVDVKLAFNTKLGNKGRRYKEEKPFFAYPYFIAITDPSGRIMAKEIFAASITFEQGEHERAYYEGLRQIIPISSKERGHRYKIVVGFQLTPDQLAYNRQKIAVEKARKEAEAQAKARAQKP